MTLTTRRAGTVQLQQRDIDGLVLCGEHGGAPYDLLAAALHVTPARLRGITARWRKAGYADTGQLGPGMTATGLGYPPGPPRLARLEHARAVLAVRLALQARPELQQGRPWWQSERRIRRTGPLAAPHRPDAEIWWPADGVGHPGQVWAIEVELTPKHADRTAAIMNMLAAAAYDHILYYAAPAARPAITRHAAKVIAPITVQDLPLAAYTPGGQA